MLVYLILTEPTQISTPVNPLKDVIAFSHVSQRHGQFDVEFIGNLIVH